MAHRHKHHKAHGGKVVYAGGESNVAHEAESTTSHKRGGKIHKRKSGGKVPGYASGGRLDKRARGGGVGADKSPFSSAHVKPREPGGNPHPHKG
jgi:hypothetical protein